MDKSNGTGVCEIELTPAMIEAGGDVLNGCFGPDYYGNEEIYREAAIKAYRAMVAKRRQK
jgi:hypothetical protein